MRPYYQEGFEYVNNFNKIPEELYEMFYSTSVFNQLDSNFILLKAGVIPRKIYFLAKGVVRAYKILENGKELTLALFSPMTFFAPFKALLNEKPSRIIYETLTDCDIFEVDFKYFIDVSYKEPIVMKAYAKFLEHLVLKSETRFLELSSFGAKERYVALQKRIPNLDNIIPQYHIASTLGITPVQLSRIRSKISYLK